MTQRNALCENMKIVTKICDDLNALGSLNTKGLAHIIVNTEDAEHSDVVDCHTELKGLVESLASILGQELQLALKNTYDDWVHVRESDLSYRTPECS